MFLTFYNHLINRISGEFLISFFLIFHIILPFFNIGRVICYKTFSGDFVFLLFLIFCIFFFFFKFFPRFYFFIVKNLFGNFFFNHKMIFSLGPIFLKNFPKLFGLYVCFSISCIYVIKTYPDIFWVYILHFFFVLFRNLCILPISGYSLIIKINQQKKEYLSMQAVQHSLLENEDLQGEQNKKLNEKDLPVFPFLENDQHFKSQFFSWVNWCNKIQPDLESAKISAKASIITGISWNGIIFFFISGKKLLDSLNLQKQYIDGVVSKVLQQQDFQKKTQILQSISIGLNIQMNNLLKNFCKYFEMNGFELIIRYIFNDSKLKNLLNQLYILQVDCIQLEYFNNLSDIQSIQSHKKDLHDLLDLLIKYNPNFLEKNKETSLYGDFLEEIYNTLQKNSIEIPIALENNLFFSKYFLY